MLVPNPALAKHDVVGPRSVGLPHALPDPSRAGYEHCDSVYVAKRVRPSNGKTHIRVCVMPGRTVHVKAANGKVYRIQEMRFPHEVNRIVDKVADAIINDKTVTAGNQDGTRRLRARNITEINIFKTPYGCLQTAKAAWRARPFVKCSSWR